MDERAPLGGATDEIIAVGQNSVLHHQALVEDRHRWAAYTRRGGFSAVVGTFNEPVDARFTGSNSRPPSPPCKVQIVLQPPYPALGEAPPPNAQALAQAERIERARWRTRFDGETALAHYPPLAEVFGISGTVSLECLVIAEQRLQCAANEDEATAGWGFAAAALALSQQMRIEPEIDGAPTLGRRVGFNMPFRQ